MITIKEFCERHGPCQEGIDWATSQGVSTMAELWELGMLPAWRVWIATLEGAVSSHKQRLFACWCMRRMWHLLTDKRSRHAVTVAERYAAGNATRTELIDAWEHAEYGRRDASARRFAEKVSATAAAWVAWPDPAEWVTEWYCALLTLRHATTDVPSHEEQAQWLIDNIRPEEISV